MKRHALRRLRSALFGTQEWSIYEPAMQALVEMLAPSQAEARFTRSEVNAAVGISAEHQPTMQMVGAVAVLPIVGVLQQRASWLTRALGWTAYEQLERDLTAAAANDQVKAIVLYCDSPGGVCIGLEEAATKIFQARKAKPIHGFVRGLCASAAYHLLSQCKSITATPSSIVGSIGTITTHMEYSKAYAAMGITVNVITHGARKGDGNPYEALTPASRAALQKRVDDYGALFDSAVARGRGIDVAEVRSRFGQGLVFLAAEAKDRGMINQVGDWDSLLASLQTPAAAGPPPHQASFTLGLAALATHDLLPASALPAGVSAGPVPSLPNITPSAAAAAVEEKRPMKVSARVRAALFARGFISAQDAEDGICLAALSAYFAARGEACPQDDDKAIAALMSAPASSAAAEKPAATAPEAGQPAANVKAAHDQEMAEARQQGAASERTRVAAIRASGKLLNLSAEQVEAAISSGESHDKVIAGWHTSLANQEKPVGQATVNVGQEGAARFVADAALALQVRLDRVDAASQASVTPEVQRMAQAPLRFYAEQCLHAAGIRVDAYTAPEEVFEQAFAMDGPGRVTISASAGPVNRPGSFPNLLSNLVNKLLDAGLELAEPTYPHWTGMWPGDLPDFKPAPVISKGQQDEMDEVLDAEKSKEFGLEEEMLSYMLLSRFSNKFGLTPVMAANDDLSAFEEGLLGMGSAWENTVNRLCLRILTGNVALLDGFALYDDTNHGNDVTAGGEPSAAQWKAMELKMAAQRGIGGKGYIRSSLAIALVPPTHKVAALQTFAPWQQLKEIKQATTDSGINVYRGLVDVVTEPELAGNSNDVWYGFVRPRGTLNATVVRAYFRGWGKKGRRQRWYDPETKTWYTELEGRVGAAAKQYRTTVRNDGVT